MRWGRLLIAAVAAVVAVPATAHAASLTSVQRTALAKLKHAPVDAPTKTRARAEIARAAHLIRTLPNGRGYHVRVALEEVASFPAALTQPRADGLYGALRANDDYFARHWAPNDKTDIVGADGAVYRYFGGYCFRFHPLANFGVLNARAQAGDVEGTEELADALLSRGVYQRGGGIAWEYDFRFGGGRAPWLSGMAQAVAAQAFARAATTVPEKSDAYLREAAAAYRAIPRHLLTSVAAGPWIRLYSFSSLAVLNAQLQATVSLQSYASATGDTEAGSLAARMQSAAAATLARFDTGYWSYYALPREPSPVDYHRFVVQLLSKLAPADPRFADAAKRFAAYLKQPPAVQLANGSVGQIRFWLSKPATVTATTPAGPTKRVSLLDGWHTLTWSPRRAGVYPVHVTAVDWLGNRSAFDTLPLVRVGAKPNPVPKAGSEPEAAPGFQSLGRSVVVWPDGATAPDAATLATAANAAVVELDAATPPTASFAQYAAALTQALPALRYLVVGPAPSAATAPQYAASFTPVRDAVRAAAPSVSLTLPLEGAADPKATLAALRRVGISADAVAFHPAPAATAAAWSQPNWTLLAQAFSGAAPPLLLDRPPAAAITAAACDARVAGAALDPATDAATATAAAEAVRGVVVCPGLERDAGIAATFPEQVVSKEPAAMKLGCARDCLYLVTLVAADGRPVVARRGSLRGGAPAATVTLPKSALGQASYTLDVRVVARVNPGVIDAVASAPLPRVSA
jgi:D-glucuronyl C5-epimerase-like protein